MTERQTVPLLPHPCTPCGIITTIVVEATRTANGGLHLAYRLRGDLDALLLPPTADPARLDGLWQHTCCEAFVAAHGSMPLTYLEFNFSPSGAWAAYAFAGTRQRQPAADPVFAAPPVIKLARLVAAPDRPAELCLTTSLPAAVLPPATRIDLGLSVVIEDRRGKCSYWALRHPAASPDFHHRDAFALSLDATP